MSLNHQITSQLFSDYLNCEYKAYLKETEKDETITDFQSFNDEVLRLAQRMSEKY